MLPNVDPAGPHAGKEEPGIFQRTISFNHPRVETDAVPRHNLWRESDRLGLIPEDTRPRRGGFGLTRMRQKQSPFVAWESVGVPTILSFANNKPGKSSSVKMLLRGGTPIVKAIE